jgi:hypothetical protein
MIPPAEPLRQLPFTARPFRRETIGSFDEIDQLLGEREAPGRFRRRR